MTWSRPKNRFEPPVRPASDRSGLRPPDSQEAWDAHLHRAGLGVPIEDVIVIDYTDPQFLNPNSEYAKLFKHEGGLIPNSATPVIITPEENTMPEENETTAAAGWSAPADQSYDFMRPDEPRFVIAFNASDALVGPFDSHEAASDYADRYDQSRRGLPHATFPAPTFHALESPDLKLMATTVPLVQVARGGPKWGAGEEKPAIEKRCRFFDEHESSITGLVTTDRCSRDSEWILDVDDSVPIQGCSLHVGYLAKAINRDGITLTQIYS